jgi:fumarate reductase flavoprotein subunit
MVQFDDLNKGSPFSSGHRQSLPSATTEALTRAQYDDNMRVKLKPDEGKMVSKQKMRRKTLKANVAIIGGGGAGLAAAIAAAENGIQNIIVLEKRSMTGGTSAMASGPFAADSPAQKRQAIIAPADDLFKRYMSWAHLKVNPRIVRAFIDKSGNTISWLEDMGVKFFCVPHSPIDSPLTWHVSRGDGAEIMQALARKCRQLGIEILVNSPADKIFTGPNHEVRGIQLFHEGKEIKISTKSLIVCTGGFAGNVEWLKKYCPTYRDSMRVGGAPNSGDGIAMAAGIGAAMDGLGMLMVAGPVTGGLFKLGREPDQLKVSLTFISGEPAAVWVNKKGRRFIDETVVFNYYESVNALVRQPDAVSYALLDSRLIEMIAANGLTNVPAGYGYGEAQRSPLPAGLEDELKGMEEKGLVKIADDWEEIGNWIGSEPQSLRTTLEEYNRACEQGHDAIFAKDRRYLLPLNQPPYYAIRCGAAILNTLGGIKISENMEVLDQNDTRIPGLFAAGVDTGGWTSDSYCASLPGTAFGYALNSGRIAGESAARFLKVKKSAGT